LALVALLLAGCGGGDPSPPQEASTAPTARDAQPNKLTSPGNAPGVSVKAVVPTGVRIVSWPVFEFDYRLVLQNKGLAIDGVGVELVSPGLGIKVVDGTVNAGSLAANSTSSPTDTITIRKHWALAFLLLPHTWQITYGPASIAGTAAVGAALANGEVSITDSAGANVCAQTSIVTSGTGAFNCTVLPGRTAPFVVVVSDPFKAYPPLVSIVPTTPSAGTTLTANATPLTTAIVGQLAPNGDALSVVADRSLINLTALTTITNNFLAQIAPVLSALGAPADYNPFTTQIVAATSAQGGNTADQVIDMLRFSTVNGVSMVATVDNPASGVPVASASTTTPPVLTAPSPTLLTLNDSLRLLTNTLAGCFALPVNTRVLTIDQTIPATLGGPEVTGLATACQSITHPTYLQNGFRIGQRLYGLLRDASMVGATFKPAEIMLFVEDSTAADRDVAVVNIRYVDTNGVVGNLIETVRKLPGSATATHASDWWMFGNQQQVDSGVNSFVRRNEQFAPAPGTAPFTNASASRFEAGINVFINKDGPGSAGMRAARVIGPGLPPAGLIYTRPDPSIITDQNWMNIRRKDGLTDALSATFSADVGNIFRLQRTQGLTGASATTVRQNPNADNSNSTAFVNWAHPIDYGAPPGSVDYINFSALRANNTYTIEVFYDGETLPRYSYTKRMLTAVTPATYAVNLRWLGLTTATLRYLGPADALAAAQASMNVAWVADPFAETISSAGVYTFGGSLSINDSVISVARGAASAAAVAPAGTVFPALTSDGFSSRTIQLRYRMLDGSYKDSVSRFN
jgi:hypothetical protein